jgi:hypothetical protein
MTILLFPFYGDFPVREWLARGILISLIILFKTIAFLSVLAGIRIPKRPFIFLCFPVDLFVDLFQYGFANVGGFSHTIPLGTILQPSIVSV